MPLSYSQLSLYRRCPKQYEYLYVKKLEKGISPQESFGVSIHSCLQKWGALEQAVARGEQPSEGGEQLAMFATSVEQPVLRSLTLPTLLALWEECFIFNTYATRAAADADRLRGVELLKHYFAWWVREPRTVLVVETGFTVTCEGVECAGRFDRVEQVVGGVRIVDYKTGSPITQQQADSDLQLSLYALAAQQSFSEPCAKLVLLYLAEDGVTEVATVRNAAQLADARTLIVGLKERLSSGDFRPTPSLSVCKWCPFRGVCPVAAVRS